MTVLIIDDDDIARLSLSECLLEAGFETCAMSSPIGATRTIRKLGVSLVVCDLNMPAMQGDAFARLFRSTPMLRDVKLVLVSATPVEKLAKFATEGLVDAVVEKAQAPRELPRLVKRLLIGSQGLAAGGKRA